MRGDDAEHGGQWQGVRGFRKSGPPGGAQPTRYGCQHDRRGEQGSCVSRVGVAVQVRLVVATAMTQLQTSAGPDTSNADCPVSAQDFSACSIATSAWLLRWLCID